MPAGTDGKQAGNMKNFSLQCDHAHEFDGWFASRESLDDQIRKQLVECPYCASTAITKMLSAPQLSTPKTRAKHITEPLPAGLPEGQAGAPARQPGASVPPADIRAAASHPDAPNMMAMRMMLKHIEQTVTSQFRNVGDKFANEARKIHSGEIDAENIYGHCTEDERARLEDEGIDVFALPDLPKDN